jgi:hypothetical protein
MGLNQIAVVQLFAGPHQPTYSSWASNLATATQVEGSVLQPVGLLIAGSAQVQNAAAVSNGFVVDVQYLTISKTIYDQIVSGAIGALPDVQQVGVPQ